MSEIDRIRKDLDEAIAHRDDYETRCIEQSIRLDNAAKRANDLVRERDEAREVARRLLYMDMVPDLERWIKSYPWFDVDTL